MKKRIDTRQTFTAIEEELESALKVKKKTFALLDVVELFEKVQRCYGGDVRVNKFDNESSIILQFKHSRIMAYLFYEDQHIGYGMLLRWVYNKRNFRLNVYSRPTNNDDWQMASILEKQKFMSRIEEHEKQLSNGKMFDLRQCQCSL